MPAEDRPGGEFESRDGFSGVRLRSSLLAARANHRALALLDQEQCRGPRAELTLLALILLFGGFSLNSRGIQARLRRNHALHGSAHIRLNGLFDLFALISDPVFFRDHSIEGRLRSTVANRQKKLAVELASLGNYSRINSPSAWPDPPSNSSGVSLAGKLIAWSPEVAES